MWPPQCSKTFFPWGVSWGLERGSISKGPNQVSRLGVLEFLVHSPKRYSERKQTKPRVATADSKGWTKSAVSSGVLTAFGRMLTCIQIATVFLKLIFLYIYIYIYIYYSTAIVLLPGGSVDKIRTYIQQRITKSHSTNTMTLHIQ
jgi:hypothetical protein